MLQNGGVLDKQQQQQQQQQGKQGALARPPRGVRLSFIERRWVHWSLKPGTKRTLVLQMPGGLYAHWAKHAKEEFDGIKKSWKLFLAFSSSLFDFFACCRVAAGPCILPSKGADSIWHAWIALDPAGLDVFCKKNFGRSIDHVEKAHFKAVNFEYGLAYCWFAACANQGIPWYMMPTLFLTDREYKMPLGYWYFWENEALRNGKVKHCDMDINGQPLYLSAKAHSGLTPQTFLGLGLISYDEFKAHNMGQHDLDSGGGDGGGGGACGMYMVGSDAADGGAGDGGGDGGGCGGGCGGGD